MRYKFGGPNIKTTCRPYFQKINFGNAGTHKNLSKSRTSMPMGKVQYSRILSTTIVFLNKTIFDFSNADLDMGGWPNRI
jgi:hypothetical protein